MFIDLTEEQRELRDHLRAYLSAVMTPQERAHPTDPPAYKRVIRRMGRDGMLGWGWPTEYGGRGLGALEQQIFVNEVTRAEVPYPLVTLQTVGPALLHHGTPEQKQRFLPGILSGKIHFAIGYTEPEAGTDLASLRTTAVRADSGDFLINGQKIYTSGAHLADHIWLAARTDPEAPKHKGISILIADTAEPGFSWTPIVTADGHHHTNTTYYSDVHVPADRLVGELNRGWRLITDQLNHERLTLGPSGNIGHLYDRFLDWAQSTHRPDGADDRLLVDEPAVRRALGRVYAYLRVNELLNWQVASTIDTGWLGAADASANKIYGSERLQEVPRIIADTVSRYGDPADPRTRDLLARLDSGSKGALVMTFGGGVNEVQRELIATLGLGLPRAPR